MPAGIVWTRLAAIGASGACVLTAVYLWGARHDAVRAGTARGLLDEGRFGAAASKAATAPGDAHALLVRAYALRDAGRSAAAGTAFAAAAAADPDNWVLRRDWAVLEAQVGDRAGAARQMAVALALNPRMKLPPGFLKPGQAAPPGFSG
jgi:Flp pilus assembly protein TadD